MSSLTNKQSCNVQLNKQTNITCPVEQTHNHNIWLQLILVVDQTSTRGVPGEVKIFYVLLVCTLQSRDTTGIYTVVYRSLP